MAEKIELNQPKSGWLYFKNYLEEQGIKHPLKLSLDKKDIPVTDGGAIIWEIKSGSNYDIVFYERFSTNTIDGKKAIAICRNVNEEFSIGLPCGGVNKF